MVLEKQGRKPDAKAQYERALALDPQLKPAKDALAAMR
jgi:Tfp pilus assembly protein PilF